jgi:hypothetical protein
MSSSSSSNSSNNNNNNNKEEQASLPIVKTEETITIAENRSENLSEYEKKQASEYVSTMELSETQFHNIRNSRKAPKRHRESYIPHSYFRSDPMSHHHHYHHYHHHHPAGPPPFYRTGPPSALAPPPPPPLALVSSPFMPGYVPYYMPPATLGHYHIPEGYGEEDHWSRNVRDYRFNQTAVQSSSRKRRQFDYSPYNDRYNDRYEHRYDDRYETHGKKHRSHREKRKERKTEVQNEGKSGLNKKRKHHSRNTLDENREYSLEELEHGLKKAVDGLARIEKRRRMMQQLEQIEEELNLMYKKLERAD